MATVLKTYSAKAVVGPRTGGDLKGLFSGVYTLWLKHMIKFRSSTMEIGGTLATPLLWMFLFGVCMDGAMAQAMKEANVGVGYLAYITPGVMLLTGLTAAILGGATLLMERVNGVIKEYLVAPIPRLSVLLGSMASGLTKALIQSILVLLLGVLLGATLVTTPLALLAGLALVVVYSVGFVGIAAAIASKARSMDSYHSLIMVMNLPVLFLSNALYPLEKMPAIIRLCAMLNPTTYAIDATRNLFFGARQEVGLLIDVPVLLVFMVLGVWYGLRQFQTAVSNPAG